MSKAERRQHEIGETKELVFARDRYTCHCGNSIFKHGTPQLAHRIPQSDLEKYGPEVLHHPMNLRACCSLKCNGKVDIRWYPLKIKKLAFEIREELDNEQQ